MRLKRDRIDDRPMQMSQPPYYDQFQAKTQKTYDKSRLPPGRFLFYLLVLQYSCWSARRRSFSKLHDSVVSLLLSTLWLVEAYVVLARHTCLLIVDHLRSKLQFSFEYLYSFIRQINSSKLYTCFTILPLEFN